MLINQNRIIALAIISILLSAWAVGTAFSKALEGTNLEILKTAVTPLSSQAKDDRIGANPKPVLIDSIPNSNISTSNIPAGSNGIASNRDMTKVEKSKPIAKEIWKDEEKKRILGEIQIIRVSQTEVTTIDGNNSITIKIGSSIGSNKSTKLIAINTLTRELTFRTVNKNVIIYY